MINQELQEVSTLPKTPHQAIDLQVSAEALPLCFGLREAAEQRQLTISDVARLSGVPITTVWRVWHNKHDCIRLATLADLATVLGLDAQDLIRQRTNP